MTNKSSGVNRIPTEHMFRLLKASIEEKTVVKEEWDAAIVEWNTYLDAGMSRGFTFKEMIVSVFRGLNDFDVVVDRMLCGCYHCRKQKQNAEEEHE